MYVSMLVCTLPNNTRSSEKVHPTPKMFPAKKKKKEDHLATTLSAHTYS